MRWILLLALAGCAWNRKDTSVCPEYRNLRCAGDTLCEMDSGRGCRVCRCQGPDPGGDPGPDNARPPDVPPPSFGDD